MRNLLEYPITDDEIIECLEEIQAETIKWYQETLICGNLRGVIITELLQRVKENKV